MAGMLDKIVVIDITNNVAGPGAAALMADYGAEVIHIEKPVWGDDSRNYFPLIEGTSCGHFWSNRGKKSVVLDLKDPRAVEVVKEMVKTADVLLESNRPGVMKRLGLDYETLKELNPRIIYCSMSAFGNTGPLAYKAGYDIIAQAYSGMMYYTGEPGGPPTKNAYSIADFVGLYNIFGCIMTALFHRERTGAGQHIDVALARGLLIINQAFSSSLTGKTRPKCGNKDFNLCPYGIFSGPGDEAIVIGAINVNLWEKLCTAMGTEYLSNDPRFRTNDVRCQNRAEVESLIESWLKTFDTVEDACKVLDSYGIPNLKVYSVDDLLHDRHALESGWITPIPVPGSIKSVSSCPGVTGVADFSAAKSEYKRAPDLGEHNMEILTRYGMTEEEVLEYQKKWSCK